jgi:hypothetical protein
MTFGMKMIPGLGEFSSALNIYRMKNFTFNFGFCLLFFFNPMVAQEKVSDN